MTLNLLEIGEKAKVSKVSKNSNLYRRFLDLGITNGEVVECVSESFFKNPRAYLIRGAVIAIRNDDAECVEVERCK